MSRPVRRLAIPMVLAVVLLLPAAGTTSAKEGMVATLDAPIPLGTPPGTELLVGMTVEALADAGMVPVEGSPIVLILTGRDGTTTEAHGAGDGTPGHYTMRIAIPPGGVRDVDVVIRGSDGNGTVDLDIRLTEDPLTFRTLGDGTAQLAPAPTPALTPWPRASAAAGAPVPAVTQEGEAQGAGAAPARTVTPASAGPAASAIFEIERDGAPWWPGPLALAALGLAVVVAVRVRLARRTTPSA